MEPLFLDSAFVIALVFKADQNYAEAQVTWGRVTHERRSFVTTTFILDEAVTFLNSRGEHALAVEIGNLLLTSPAIEMVDVERALLEHGWEYFVRHKDKSYSLTDCISFVIMNDRAISEALTFDAHFTQAGFQIVPLRQRILRTATRPVVALAKTAARFWPSLRLDFSVHKCVKPRPVGRRPGRRARRRCRA